MTEKLNSIISRIERLSEEKQGIADDIKSIFLEAKSGGFDVKALRAVLKLRKKSKQERETEEAIIDTYINALGM